MLHTKSMAKWQKISPRVRGPVFVTLSTWEEKAIIGFHSDRLKALEGETKAKIAINGGKMMLTALDMTTLKRVRKMIDEILDNKRTDLGEHLVVDQK